jgi:hypothetical protein
MLAYTWWSGLPLKSGILLLAHDPPYICVLNHSFIGIYWHILNKSQMVQLRGCLHDHQINVQGDLKHIGSNHWSIDPYETYIAHLLQPSIEEFQITKPMWNTHTSTNSKFVTWIWQYSNETFVDTVAEIGTLNLWICRQVHDQLSYPNSLWQIHFGTLYLASSYKITLVFWFWCSE